MLGNVTRAGGEKNRWLDNYQPLYICIAQMLLVWIPYEYPIYAKTSPIYVQSENLLRSHLRYQVCLHVVSYHLIFTLSSNNYLIIVSLNRNVLFNKALCVFLTSIIWIRRKFVINVYKIIVLIILKQFLLKRNSRLFRYHLTSLINLEVQ